MQIRQGYLLINPLPHKYPLTPLLTTPSFLTQRIRCPPPPTLSAGVRSSLCRRDSESLNGYPLSLTSLLRRREWSVVKLRSIRWGGSQRNLEESTDSMEDSKGEKRKRFHQALLNLYHPPSPPRSPPPASPQVISPPSLLLSLLSSSILGCPVPNRSLIWGVVNINLI